MNRRPPRSTRTDTLFPYTTLFRSALFLLTIPSGATSVNIPDVSLVDPRVNIAAADWDFNRTHELNLLRSEENTSELQSLMRISYAVFCLKKKKIQYKYILHF